MAVEIRELIVRAVITNEGDNTETADSGTERVDEKEAIIQECVDQVLKILKKDKLR